MTEIGLRDYFAAHALSLPNDQRDSPEVVAKRAYTFADAMIAAREQPDSPTVDNTIDESEVLRLMAVYRDGGHLEELTDGLATGFIALAPEGSEALRRLKESRK